MPQSRRALKATADLTTTPPDTLPPHHTIARIVRAAGNNLYAVEYPPSPTPPRTSRAPTVAYDDNKSTNDAATPQPRIGPKTDQQPQPQKLVELHPRFRNTIYLKRGSFVVVDTAALSERANKLGGEIVNVVREEKRWRGMGWWPEVWRGRGAGGDRDGMSEGYGERRRGRGDGSAGESEEEMVTSRGGQSSRVGQMPDSGSESEDER